MEFNNLENEAPSKDSFSPVSNSLTKMSEHNQQRAEDPNLQQNDSKKGFFAKHGGLIGEFVMIIVIAAIIVFPIRYFVFQPFIVSGDSMVPNFHSGDYLIVDELSYRLGAPERGDVVVLKYPLDTTQRFIKRIIGLPGETIKIKDGKIDISKDGKDIILDEKKYLPNLSGTDGDVNVTLAADKYFVLGDNRQFSYDSRRWGILPKEDIIGKAIFRVLPLTNVSLIKAPTY